MESYEPPKFRYIKMCLYKKTRVLGIVAIWCSPRSDMQSIA
jgi:hypothetical protein